MKNNLSLLLFLLSITAQSLLHAQTVPITLTNATTYDRVDETVAFSVSQEIYDALSTLALYNEDEAIIPYQALSGADRKIVFQATVDAGATVVYTLKPGSPATAAVKTYAAQKKPATRNDIAWENDLSAYRMYSRVLLATEPNTANGVDIWYKKQAAPVIDAMYEYTSPDYHNEVAGRLGVDAYSVGGKTLGGGGLVAFVNSQLLLHDPYDECTIIESGPLRSEFILTYKKVQIDGDYYTKTLHVTVNAGALLNKAVVKFEGKLKPMKIAAGLFLHTGTNGLKYTSESNIIGYAEDKSEGSVLNAASRMYTGVYMPGETTAATHTASNHLIISSDYAVGSEFTYYFGGGWNMFPAGKYSADQDWFNALKQFKASISSPLIQTTAQLPLKKEIISVAERANNYWIAKNNASPGDNLWARSAYFAANMDFYKVYPKKIYLNYAIDWATRNNWAVSGGPSTSNADNHTCGQAYIDLYLLDSVKVPSKITPIKNAIDYRINNNTRSDDWWWVDAMFMAMPTIARLGAVYSDIRYFNKLHALYRNTRDTLVVNPGSTTLWTTANRTQYGPGPIVTCTTCGNEADGLYNRADKLWWRDWGYQPGVPNKGWWYPPPTDVPKTSPDGRNIYWARGNGWVLGAMVRTLQFVPDTLAQYQEYVTMLQEMAEALKDCQRPDGFWNMNLGDPNHFPGPETSGTAFFTYGLAWGINNGFLDRNTYYPVVAKAWNGLAALTVQTSGKVKYTQNVGEAPIDPAGLNADVDFGVGAVLLAASEVVKLAEGEMPQVPAESLSLLSVQLQNPRQVKVAFDSDLESASALNTSNYIIRLESPLATEITPANATLDGTKNVILTFTDSLDYGRYNLTASEIKSLNDAVMEVDSKRFLRTVPLSPVQQPVTVTASGYQQTSTQNNPPAHAIDNNLGTRWAHDGTGQWLRFDLGRDVEVYAVDIAYYSGDQRTSFFNIVLRSSAEANYTSVLSGGTTSGITNEMERYAFPPRTARYVQLICNGNSIGGENWNSITEVRIRYTDGSDVKTPEPAEKTVRIIPNPVANGQLTVYLGEELQGKATLNISDVNGKNCISEQIRSKENYLQIDVRNLPQGIYILSIDNGQKQIHDTFIVK